MTTDMRIAIAGAAGRMGQSVYRAALNSGHVVVAGALERPGSPIVGHDVGAALGLPACGALVTDDAKAAGAAADAWIDFSTSDAVATSLPALAQTPVRAAVIGATGLSERAEAAIAETAQRIAVVRSGNFSVGVTVLSVLTRRLAETLGPEWDIEILDMHHRRKVDAPSGTALLLGEAAAAGRGKSLHDLRLEPRHGVTGARPDGGIGFAVMRAGGVIGEHEVIFASENETLRLAHHAHDRSLFADGALRAARWALGQKPGLYAMTDVLGL